MFYLTMMRLIYDGDNNEIEKIKENMILKLMK